MSGPSPAMLCCLCDYTIITERDSRGPEHSSNVAWQMTNVCDHVLCNSCAYIIREGVPYHLRCEMCPNGERVPSKTVDLKEIFITETVPPPPVALRQMQYELDRQQTKHNKLAIEAARLLAVSRDLDKQISDSSAEIEAFVKQYEQ
ncbi:hypothetical protein FRC09_010662 [Ceratobasidium sp. 395]|nr:hypothetical protein FRC09_010662 [Ceratobasidium sp. 395]